MSRFARHPGDVVRVLVGVAVLSGGAVLARRADPGTLEVNLFRLVNDLPGFLAAPLLGIMQLGTLGMAPIAAAVTFFAGQRRLARPLLIGGVGAWAVAHVLQRVVDQEPPEVSLARVVLHGNPAPGLAFPAAHVAVAAALLTVAGPYVSRATRRIGWLLVTLVAVARIYTGAHFPVDVVGGAALGWSVGALVHLVFGAPRGRASPAFVSEAIGALHGGPAAVEAEMQGEPGAVVYRVRRADGSAVLAKVVGRDQPDADWLWRAWRLLAFRDSEDAGVITNPGHRVDHEAYVMLLAEREGVRVPRLIATHAMEGGEQMLVREWPGGRAADEVGGDLTETALAEVWTQLRRLHAAGVVHGRMIPSNVIVDDKGNVWLTEFSRASTDATSDDRARDVAELLAGLSLALGPERVAHSAATVLGDEAVSASLGRLQPLTLSASTRRRLAQDAQVLPLLRAEVARIAGVTVPALESPARLAARNLVPLVGLGFAVYVLLPRVGQAHATADALGRAHWAWLLAIAFASGCTYLMAALALMGAARVPLALGRTWAVQLAAAFTNRLAPAGLGGMATNVRYLVSAGSDRGAAVTAVGLNSLAGLLVHLTGFAGVVPLLGAGGGIRAPAAPDLPDRWWLLVAVLGAFVVAGAARWGRSVAQHATAGLRSASSSLRAVAIDPRRAVALFGGAAGVTTGYALGLVAAVNAFGGGIGVGKVMAVYLGGSALAAAAPTPGGLGPLEAALVAGLTGVGMATGQAVASVLVYRLVSYWTPVLPGFFLYRLLRSRAVL